MPGQRVEGRRPRTTFHLLWFSRYCGLMNCRVTHVRVLIGSEFSRAIRVFEVSSNRHFHAMIIPQIWCTAIMGFSGSTNLCSCDNCIMKRKIFGKRGLVINSLKKV